MPTLSDVQAALNLIGGLASLWPDFEPAAIPLVIWDGIQTTLLQTSVRPSEAWQPWPGGWSWPGRHPALVANTALTLEGGVEAAAVLLTVPSEDMTLPELAALIVHESFHVFQQRHAPERWRADELAVFGYPLTREVLAARRLETLALRQALEEEAGWPEHAAEALHWREQRFAHLTAAQTEMERGLERLEGLAHFVELKVTGQPPRLPLPDFAPAQIRGRCYATGAAMAVLLDRTGEWMADFMDSPLSLDELLRGRVGHQTSTTLAPELVAPELVAEAQRAASLDARNVIDGLRLTLDVYLSRPGQRLTLMADSPIWPQGFDPLNIADLGGGAVLHGRFLRFGHAQGSGEVMGREVLTQAAGSHPLLGGFSALILTGLEGLRVWTDAEVVHAEAEGFQLRVSGAAATALPDGWEIRLP